MTRSLPIRVRLTIWYSAALALCLIAFGVIVWFGLRANLVSARQAEVDERFTNLRTVLSEESQTRDSGETVRDDVIDFSATLPSDFSLQFSGSDGSVFHSHHHPFKHSLQRDGALVLDGHRYGLRLVASLELMDEFLLRLQHIFQFAIPFAILMTTVGGYWLSGRALKPMKEMAFAAQAIGAGDLSVRLPVPPARDELSLLANMWNEMLGRLESSVERIRTFTSDASHDLRTPLAAIRASAEIALRRPRDPEHYGRTLEAIIRQADRATSLVEDLLVLARNDGELQSKVLAGVNLTPIVADACDSLRPRAEAKSLDLRLDAKPDPILVRGNKDILARVALALIDNAIKYTDRGLVEVQLAVKGPLLTLTVRDTGRGISAADLPNIFDRFYRGDKSRNSAGGGFGLGLSIAKESVTLHQGTIEVESVLGQGSRFVVRLPLALNNPNNNPSPGTVPVQS